MCNLEMDALNQNQVDAISQYADAWIGNKAPNQPIRMDGSTLAAEIGYDSFGKALQAWNTIR